MIIGGAGRGLMVDVSAMKESYQPLTDIFLPKWAADRIFPVCGKTFVVALGVLLARMLA